MYKVVVTGADGLFGSDLATYHQHSYEVIPLDKYKMNITKAEEVYKILNRIKPDFVIHTAAYTKVDDSEIYRSQAFEVNCIGTQNIALACKRLHATLVYLSTDYVFDGEKKGPYTEVDTPNPLNWYGQTKLFGEKTIKNLLNNYFIVRTSWLYDIRGKNFLTTILERASQKIELRVVNDQIGCPTYVKHLRKAIYELIGTNNYGTYHASNSGFCSWYDFANEILKGLGKDVSLLQPIESSELKRFAIRPLNSALINTKEIYQMEDWQVALADLIEGIQRTK